MTATVHSAAEIEVLVRIIHRIGIHSKASANISGQLWERVAEGVAR